MAPENPILQEPGLTDRIIAEFLGAIETDEGIDPETVAKIRRLATGGGLGNQESFAAAFLKEPLGDGSSEDD